METTNQLITRQQAAELLSVSIRTIDNLLESGRLGSVYIGTSRRLSFDEVKHIATFGAK
jgi:excisionase family DNA binding protein